jgi:hypothetical protein
MIPCVMPASLVGTSDCPFLAPLLAPFSPLTLYTGTFGPPLFRVSLVTSIRLVLVVTWLYLLLAHATSAFSLPLAHHGSSSRLQLPAHSYINIRHINLLSPNQQHHSILNYFRIHFVDNKFEKTIL